MFIGLYLIYAPIPRFGLGQYSALLTYLDLRYYAYYAAFFTAAFLGLVFVLLKQRWAALPGIISCVIPLNLAFLSTSNAYIPYNLYPAGDSSGFPVVSPLFVFPTIAFACIMAVTAAGTASHFTTALVRLFEAGSIAVLPLPVYIFFFDSGELSLHVTNYLLQSISNADLLVIAPSVLAAAVFCDLLLHLRNLKL